LLRHISLIQGVKSSEKTISQRPPQGSKLVSSPVIITLLAVLTGLKIADTGAKPGREVWRSGGRELFT
jgi:hypothetical protein